MASLPIVLSLLLLAPAPAADECAPELAGARALHRAAAEERLRAAEPLARAVRQVIERTLADEDRALLRDFRAGRAGAGEVDERVWPKLRGLLSRFNAADCRHLGGVASVEEGADAVTALRGGRGLHTAVVVRCARRIPGLAARRHLGLRIRHDDEGPAVVLHGFVEAAPGRRLAVAVPLGDRDAERAALDAALAAVAGDEADFTWTVPLDCRERRRVSSAVPSSGR